MVERLDAIGAGDGIGPYPRAPADAAAFFHRWLTRGNPPDTDGLPLTSYFHFERSWWKLRDRPNVLLVHYADLKADLAGGMRRVADFLGIEVPAALWPDSGGRGRISRRCASVATPSSAPPPAPFRGGGETFFHHGENVRWRGILHADDLALYQAKLADLPPACARWLEHGAQGSGRPDAVQALHSRT